MKYLKIDPKNFCKKVVNISIYIELNIKHTLFSIKCLFYLFSKVMFSWLAVLHPYK